MIPLLMQCLWCKFKTAHEDPSNLIISPNNPQQCMSHFLKMDNGIKKAVNGAPVYLVVLICCNTSQLCLQSRKSATSRVQAARSFSEYNIAYSKTVVQD